MVFNYEDTHDEDGETDIFAKLVYFEGWEDFKKNKPLYLQLLEDQKSDWQNAEWEAPIESNVYGAFLVLLMIRRDPIVKLVEGLQNAHPDTQEELETQLINLTTQDFADAVMEIAREEEVDSDDDRVRNWLCFLGSCFWVIITLSIQLTFGYFMLTTISQDEYEEKLDLDQDGLGRNLYREWRAAHVADAGLACNGKSFTFSEGFVDEMKKYTDSATFLVFEFPRGIMYGLMSLVVWSAVVTENVRKAVAYFSISLPGNSSQAGADKTFFALSLQGRLALFVIGLCRIAMQLCVAINGVKFLARTDNLTDFILNSIALEFIYQIPDKMYTAFVSTRTHAFVEAAAKSKEVGPLLTFTPWYWMKVADGWFWTVFGGLGLTLYGHVIISPFFKQIHDQVFKELCPP